jgi:hypothetical protein
MVCAPEQYVPQSTKANYIPSDAPNFAEGASVLKKWLSARSAVQESPKTRPNTTDTAYLGPEPGAEERAKEFFNTLGHNPNFASTAYGEISDCDVGALWQV